MKSKGAPGLAFETWDPSSRFLLETPSLLFVIRSVPGFPASLLSPTTTDVVLSKENHTQLTEVTAPDRKSGEAEGSAVRHSGAPNLSFYNRFPFVILKDDKATTRPVAVINEAFARRFFKNENPLGKQFGRVLRMVLRGAFSQVAIGLAIGIPAAIGAGKLMTQQLFSVRPWDPVMLASATLAFGLAALLASALPAWRAAGVEPMVALRNE